MKPKRPQPKSPEERERWEHVSKVHRILTGQWTEDAQTALADLFDSEAIQYLPKPDLSRNPLLSTHSQIATTHDGEVLISATGDPDLAPLRLDLVWPLLLGADLFASAMNEVLYRVVVQPDGRACRLRIVTPDCIEAYPHEDEPTRPAVVRELRWRERYSEDGTEEGEWVWETWDARDPAAPAWRLTNAEGYDVTEKWSPGSVSGEWPALYRDRAGLPVMPYILRHDQIGTRLWNWRRGTELVEGTLRVSALWTYWIMLARDVSTPQRVLIDGDVSETGTGPGQPTAPVIKTSPIHVLRVRSDSTGSARLDSWTAPGSALDQATALDLYEGSLGQYAGLTAADISRGTSTAGSGYAIVVSRDGLRRVQRRKIPAARVADQELLATMARLLWRVASLPESPDDYLVSYPGVGESIDDQSARTDLALREVEAGVRNPAEIVQARTPGMTSEEAIAYLVEAASTRAMLASVASADPAAIDHAAVIETIAAIRDAAAAGQDVEDLLADLGSLVGAGG